MTIVCSAAVAEPTLDGITPTTGTTAGGTSVTITGTNLTGATGVSICGVAATGITVVSPTTITATTPAHATGSINVAVTTLGGTAVMANSFTFVAANPPVANAGSASVTADSSENLIALDITGGLATSVAVGSQASHGTATASGTSINYTRLSGYSGSDSFTYIASNADGASTPAIVSVTVVAAEPTLDEIAPNTGTTAGGTSVTITGTSLTGATGVSFGGVAATDVTVVSTTTITATSPAHAAGSVNVAVTAPGGAAVMANSFTFVAQEIVVSPASGSLPEATSGTAYNQALSVTGGTALFLFGVSGFIPAGLAVNPSTGAISGTPTTAGNYNLTVIVTDANDLTGSIAYTLTVNPAQASFLFTPRDGDLKDAMAGEDYDQSISATGGTGALTYSLATGALPDGMTLNISTGELTGPVAVDAEEKVYAFNIQVRDGNGSTGTAGYLLSVKARAAAVTNKIVTVEAGSPPPDVYLNRGATGGPFVQAEKTSSSRQMLALRQLFKGNSHRAGPSPHLWAGISSSHRTLLITDRSASDSG